MHDKNKTTSEKVAIVKIKDNLYDAFNNAINLIGGFDVKDGETVVIKPNLSDLKHPKTGVTTSLQLIEAIIQFIKERANAEIIIVESNHWLATAEEEFHGLGYHELAKKDGIKLVNLSKDTKITIKLNGFYFDSILVPEILVRCNKLISVAKLKTHAHEKISCILKNQFGLITERYKSKYHPYLSEVLTDLAKLYRPDLCVIDGGIALEGAGPSGGTPKEMGILMVGKDPIATDLVASKIMGFDPHSVPHLRFAMTHSVGVVKSFKDVKTVGENIEDVQTKFEFIPSLSYSIIRFSYAMIRFGNGLSNIFKRVGNALIRVGNYYAYARARGKIRTTIKAMFIYVLEKTNRFLTNLKRRIY